MIKNIVQCILLVTSVIRFSSPLSAQQKTLLNKDGELIRATAIAVAKNYKDTSNKFCENPETWQKIKDLHLNAVRVCWVDPWFERRNYTAWSVDDPEVTALFDKAVQNAVDKDMTIIINYHSAGDQEAIHKKDKDESTELMQPEGFDRIRKFWEIIAPRYKDNPNVIYEIINEPAFSTQKYLSDPFKSDFLDVYKMVRQQAPDREIIMFSFNGINYDLEPVIEGYKKDIDWDKTSIGYHLYQKDRADQVRRLGRKYRVICTEWDYPETHRYVKTVDGYEINTEFFEVYHHSWMDWSGWDDNSLKYIQEVMIPHAVENKYQWWEAQSEDKNIIVRAKGTENAEELDLQVNGKTIKKLVLSDTLDNYKVPYDGEIKKLRLKLKKGKERTDILVDYVAVDGTFKDAEDQKKNTSVYQNGSCGGTMSDKMNCKGFIDFGSFSK